MEIAVDRLLAPRTGTLAQQQTMRELAMQLGEVAVLTALEAAVGQANGYGAALERLTDAAKHARDGNGAERNPGEAPNPRHEGQHPDCFVCGTVKPVEPEPEAPEVSFEAPSPQQEAPSG